MDSSSVRRPTFGVDKLATGQYTNGNEIDIRAGSLIALSAGVDYTVNPAFSLQASVGPTSMTPPVPTAT